VSINDRYLYGVITTDNTRTLNWQGNFPPRGMGGIGQGIAPPLASPLNELSKAYGEDAIKRQQEQLNQYVRWTFTQTDEVQMTVETLKAPLRADQTVEQLTALYAELDRFIEASVWLGVSPIPKWAEEKRAEIKDAVKVRLSAERRAELKKKRDALNALKSKEVQRQELEREIAELEKVVG
jgi:hypothetical protein